MAHRLAKFALHCEGFHSLFEESSDLLSDLFVLECNGWLSL